ncbi:hypothetical protein F443_22966 [Phytophthora nicotianae P1569]|uniref:Chromo domain-containing protein n=1 Tax=Phytophthora nicotianae P1569 TaxID=1317065 RepID=V9DTG6_PHYNI|nr:hypothetical protein F443_22966 [Phytophthora nicotianae P1569]
MFDFDEELLPEDSWEPDHLAGEYEVEAILDDRMPLSTSTERAVREFKVKWVGYDNQLGNHHPTCRVEVCCTTICEPRRANVGCRWLRSLTRISVVWTRMNCSQGGAACDCRRKESLHQQFVFAYDDLRERDYDLENGLKKEDMKACETSTATRE